MGKALTDETAPTKNNKKSAAKKLLNILFTLVHHLLSM